MLVAHNVELLRRLSLFTNCRSAHKLARILIVPRSLEKVTAKHKHTPFRLAPAHTHLPVNVTAALNPSQLTDLHLQFTLTKFYVTIGSHFALHIKNRPRKASVIHLHTQTQPIGLHFPSASCSDIIAGAMLLLNHSAQLLQRNSLFITY